MVSECGRGSIWGRRCVTAWLLACGSKRSIHPPAKIVPDCKNQLLFCISRHMNEYPKISLPSASITEETAVVHVSPS